MWLHVLFYSKKLEIRVTTHYDVHNHYYNGKKKDEKKE